MPSTQNTMPPRVGLLSLPAEVLDFVIQHLSSSFDDALFTQEQDVHGIACDRRRRVALSNVCRSCKTLASIATTHLYRSVTLARREHSSHEDSSPGCRFDSDSAVLFLRTLIEAGSGSGGDNILRGLVRDVRSLLILRQAYTYQRGPWPVHDPEIIAGSWGRVAHTIRVSASDTLAVDVLRHCELLAAGEHGSRLESADSLRCLPERVVAAVLLLCHSLRSVTLACPPWDTQIPGIHAQYRVLDHLISRAVVGEDDDTGYSAPRATRPLRRLQAVTFTGMQGLARSRAAELYMHGGFAGGCYIARGDACPALARVASVCEVSSHGTLGGWEDLLAPAPSLQSTRLPSPPPDEEGRGGKDTAMIYKRLHIGSASLNTALEALSAEDAHEDGDTAVTRIRPHTIQELVLFQSAVHDRPMLSRDEVPLDLDTCDRALARHARSLRALDMMTCWDLVSAREPSAEQQQQQQVRAAGPPRPLCSLGLMDQLEVLRIALPLIATNRDLWWFYGMQERDIVAAAERSEERGSGGTGAPTREDVPFLRCIPRGLRVLRIGDYRSYVPHSPYLEQCGEYGSGNGVPTFDSYKDADAAAALAAGTGGSSNPENCGNNNDDEDDDYGADRGADGWTAAVASPEASPTQPSTTTLPLSLSSTATTGHGVDGIPTRELTHKYLLPLALRRLAGVCGRTHPYLRSIIVDTEPLLRYHAPALARADGRSRAPIDWLVRGGGEIRDMFATSGVGFEALCDVESAGRMEFGAGC
ncbi:hypothetical protein MN608_11700 [Microdochium nivale]|nr:hypothetical protein MN608_11700 [Microdochium nivale]